MIGFLKACSGLAIRYVFRYGIHPLESALLGMVDFQPTGWRKGARETLGWLKDVGWLLFTRFRAGVVRWDGAEWCVVLIHDGCTHSQEELKPLLFPDVPAERDEGWVFLWQVPRIVRGEVARGNLVICDLNRLLRLGKGYRYAFRVPPWLRANIDVSGSEASILKRISRNLRAAVKKLPGRGYTCEFSRRPEDLEMFYHDMYLPHAAWRHQERAVIGPIEAKRAIFEKGGLLLLKRQGQIVAAGLTQVVGRISIWANYAIHRDHFQLIEQDVVPALYWSQVHWARQNGLASIDLGTTRPYLSNGLFGYKRRWGARFERDILAHTVWTFVGESLSRGLIQRLNRLGLIAECDRGYRCLVLDAGAPSALDEFSDFERSAARAGLDGLFVVSPEP